MPAKMDFRYKGVEYVIKKVSNTQYELYISGVWQATSDNVLVLHEEAKDIIEAKLQVG